MIPKQDPPLKRSPVMMLGDDALIAHAKIVHEQLQAKPHDISLLREWGIICPEVNFRGLDYPPANEAGDNVSLEDDESKADHE